MLDQTSTIKLPQHVDVVTGQQIARSHWDQRYRVRLAAGWRLSLVRVEPPTTKMAAEVFGVSAPEVAAAIEELAPAVTERKANGNSVPALDLLLHHWRRASSEERAAFGRAVGVSVLWDCAINPNI